MVVELLLLLLMDAPIRMLRGDVRRTRTQLPVHEGRGRVVASVEDRAAVQMTVVV